MPQPAYPPISPLTAVSPGDGRYASKTANLRPLFSEYALIQRRIHIEAAWLKTLAGLEELPEIPQLSPAMTALLDRCTETFDTAQAERVKALEKTTNHDVKAVEYYLRDYLKKHEEAAGITNFIHFACTSEDVNNLAWAWIVMEARTLLLQTYRNIEADLVEKALRYASLVMLARTHGQPASPTTLGKELANVAHRLHRQTQSLERIEITAKFNGAVGNYNAHVAACPEIDWPAVTSRFIVSFGLTPLPYTTQIEPHDSFAEILDAIGRINRILLDLCRDVWGYTALDYFTQKHRDTEVGSSTMPHKVNPIDFENAEGNFGIANALAQHLAEKLPISRWQRDLSDSTAMRSLGLVFSHTMIALDALRQGLSKIEAASEVISDDLERHWEVLAEALQTVMRRYGISDGYEELKKLTRGKKGFGKKEIQPLIDHPALPEDVRQRLLALTPGAYTGLAEELARAAADELKRRS